MKEHKKALNAHVPNSSQSDLPAFGLLPLYSLSEYSLSIYYVTDTVLHIWESGVNKTKSLPSVEEFGNKQIPLT